MKSYCLNRLFHPRSGRCFDAAVGHGFFNQHGFLTRSLMAMRHDGAVPTALAMISQLPAHDR